eukprot:39824_1
MSIYQPHLLLLFMWCNSFLIVVYFVASIVNVKKDKRLYYASTLSVDVSFNDKENAAITAFHSRHRDYEQLFSNVIGDYLDKKYMIEVTLVKRNINDNNLNLSLSVEWDNKMQETLSMKDAILIMENHCHERLSNVRFAKRILEFCENSNEKLPVISIQGTAEIQDIYQYQVDQYNATKMQQSRKIEDITSKPLHDMTNEHIKELIELWLLLDTKFTKYSDEIMIIMKTKNINGMLIEEMLKNNIDIKGYLNGVIGEFVSKNMMNKIVDHLSDREQVSLSPLDSNSLAQLICDFPIKNMQRNLNKNINGVWIINNLHNNEFIEMLQRDLAITEQDASQIHHLFQRQNVPNDAIILSYLKNEFANIIDLKLADLEAIFQAYPVNYVSLALNMKNNGSIHKEAEIIANLFHYIVVDANVTHQNTQYKVTFNYNMISNLYESYANIFSKLFLNNWWCSNCNYHNRICKIGGNKLIAKDEFMLNCMICGCDKIKSIANTLRNNKIQNNLFDKHENIDELDWKPECSDKNDITKCEEAKKLLKFMGVYSHKEYATTISTLYNLNSKQIYLHIISPAIEQVNDETQRKLLFKIFKHNEDYKPFKHNEDYKPLTHSDTIDININGSDICSITEQDFIQMIFEKNVHITAAKFLYQNIFYNCDVYVTAKRAELFGVSWNELIRIWKHVFMSHLDWNDFNSYKYFIENMSECNKSNCKSISRNKIRHTESDDQVRFKEQTDFKYEYPYEQYQQINVNECNQHIQSKLLDEEYYQSVLDSIHCNLLHPKSQRQEIKRSVMNDYLEQKEEEETKTRTRVSTDTNVSNYIEMTELKSTSPTKVN